MDRESALVRLAMAITVNNAINGVAFGQAVPVAQPTKETVEKERSKERPAAHEQKAALNSPEPRKSQPIEIPGKKAEPETAMPGVRIAPSDSSGSDTRSLDKKIDALQVGMNNLANKISSSGFWSLRDIGYLITGFAAVAGLLLTYRASLQNRHLAITQLQRNVNDEKAKALQKKLDDFFGPLVQLRSTSNLLYDVFRSRQPDPENFRTLTALLSEVPFEGNDKVLLDEIIKIGKETEELIFKSSGLVDGELQQLLGKATAHYRILRLAHEGLLKGEPEKFKAHVYPRELDRVIAQKIGEIQAEMNQLLAIEMPREMMDAAGDDLISVGH